MRVCVCVWISEPAHMSIKKEIHEARINCLLSLNITCVLLEIALDLLCFRRFRWNPSWLRFYLYFYHRLFFYLYFVLFVRSFTAHFFYFSISYQTQICLFGTCLIAVNFCRLFFSFVSCVCNGFIATRRWQCRTLGPERWDGVEWEPVSNGLTNIRWKAVNSLNFILKRRKNEWNTTSDQQTETNINWFDVSSFVPVPVVIERIAEIRWAETISREDVHTRHMHTTYGIEMQFCFCR